MQLPFPSLLRTYRLANNDPIQLFNEIGLQDKIIVRQRGFQKLVIITHPDHLHHILVKQHQKYDKAPFLRLLWGPYFGNGLLTSSGKIWRQHRKLISPAFHSRIVEIYASKTVEDTKRLVESWKQKAAQSATTDLASDFANFSLKLVSGTTLLGAMNEEETEAFIKALNHVEAKIRFRDIAGIAHLLPQRPAAKRRKIIEAVDIQARRTLERRRKQKSNIEYPDILDLLITAQASETTQPISDQDIIDEIKTFFLAGFEVLSIILSWSLYLISSMPMHYRIILKELSAFPANYTFTYSDLPRLEYLGCFIQEVMRLYPTSALMSRQATEEDRIDGVLIPKGSLIEMNIWKTHRHPDFWESPDEFSPERFLAENSTGRHKHAYLPFGAGPRVCIGKTLSMAQFQLCLATILRELNFTPLKDQLPRIIGASSMQPKGPLEVKISLN